MATVKINTKAPNFAINDVTGAMFKLADFQGKSNVFLVLNRGFV